jgi:hypothetical protein
LSNGPEPFQKVIVFAFAIGVQQEIQNITISLGRMIFPMTPDGAAAVRFRKLVDLGTKALAS